MVSHRVSALYGSWQIVSKGLTISFVVVKVSQLLVSGHNIEQEILLTGRHSPEPYHRTHRGRCEAEVVDGRRGPVYFGAKVSRCHTAHLYSKSGRPQGIQTSRDW